MTMLVIGLYDQSNEANRAIDALKDAGFNKSDIECIEKDEKRDEDTGFFEGLFSKKGGDKLESEDLTEMGVSKDDARFYTKAVNQGRSLVIVRCAEEDTGKVRNILARFDLSNFGQKEKGIDKGTRRGMEHEAGAGVGHTERSLDGGRGVEERRTEGMAMGEKAQRGEQEKFQEVEEELHVGKREIKEGGVRVSTKVHETPVEEEIELRDESIDVERRSVDRPVQAGEDVFREESAEFVESRQEPIVEKETRVTEEVVVGKDVDERTERVSETLRSTEINVENLYAKSEDQTDRYNQYESEFRRHYDQNLAGGSESFDEHSHGYRYGMTLADHEPYRSRTWESVEPEAERGWEAHNKGTWDRFKDSVREGWNRMRGEGEEERPSGRF